MGEAHAENSPWNYLQSTRILKVSVVRIENTNRAELVGNVAIFSHLAESLGLNRGRKVKQLRVQWIIIIINAAAHAPVGRCLFSQQLQLDACPIRHGIISNITINKQRPLPSFNNRVYRSQTSRDGFPVPFMLARIHNPSLTSPKQ